MVKILVLDYTVPFLILPPPLLGAWGWHYCFTCHYERFWAVAEPDQKLRGSKFEAVSGGPEQRRGGSGVKPLMPLTSCRRLPTRQPWFTCKNPFPAMICNEQVHRYRRDQIEIWRKMVRTVPDGPDPKWLCGRRAVALWLAPGWPPPTPTPTPSSAWTADLLGSNDPPPPPPPGSASGFGFVFRNYFDNLDGYFVRDQC